MNVLYGDLTSVNTINQLVERIEILEAEIKKKQEIIDKYVSNVEVYTGYIQFTLKNSDGTTTLLTYPPQADSINDSIE